MIEFVAQTGGRVEQILPFLGEGDLATRADKERCLKMGLELSYLITNCAGAQG